MSMIAMLHFAEAWAASTAAGVEHAANVSNLLFPLVNFLIFIYIIKRLVVPLLRNHIRSKRAEILDAVRSAGEEKEQAEAVLRDYRERMARQDQESQEICETLRTEGEREKAKLIQEAQELSAKLKTDADFLAQQEEKIARQQIREEIARLARDTAEKIIKANLTEADQERLGEQFLQQIEATR